MHPKTRNLRRIAVQRNPAKPSLLTARPNGRTSKGISHQASHQCARYRSAPTASEETGLRRCRVSQEARVPAHEEMRSSENDASQKMTPHPATHTSSAGMLRNRRRNAKRRGSGSAPYAESKYASEAANSQRARAARSNARNADPRSSVAFDSGIQSQPQALANSAAAPKN